MHSSALEGFYERTRYRVRLVRGGCATIRIGEPLPGPLLDVLSRTGAPWAFLTAWNPRSEPLPVLTNRARQRALIGALRDARVTMRAGVGVSEDGTWREPSLFVAGLAFDRVDTILRPFAQHAMVRGRGAGPAELHWLD